MVRAVAAVVGVRRAGRGDCGEGVAESGPETWAPFSSSQGAYDPDYFVREVLPGLARVELAGIMEAAGCSKSYPSNIRAGRHTPHMST